VIKVVAGVERCEGRTVHVPLGLEKLYFVGLVGPPADSRIRTDIVRPGWQAQPDRAERPVSRTNP
jgi:hypothetical protein